MLESLKRSFKWIKNNIKYILLFGSFAILVIFFVLLSSKSKKIRLLQNQLRIMKAKLDLERLAIKNDVEREKLKEIREHNEVLKLEISRIRNSLEKNLEDMSMEEMKEVFEKLGF